MVCIVFKPSRKKDCSKYDITSVLGFTFNPSGKRKMTCRPPTRRVDRYSPQSRSQHQLLTVLLVTDKVSFGWETTATASMYM